MHTAHNTSHVSEISRVEPFKQVEIGRIRNVGSSVATIAINNSVIRNNQLNLAQIGTILKIVTHKSVVVAMVSSLRIGSTDEEGMSDGCVAQLNIMGEITTNETTRQTRFFRGVRSFPVLGEAVYNMSSAELGLIFNRENESCIEVGRLQQDNSIIAKVRIDDLLSKHFAIIGSTGSGKSCTVALVLQAILDKNPMGHVVLFDPHNEYSKSFGARAEVINQDSLDLPLWIFDFVETCELLCSGIEDQAREEREILHDVILKAKRLFDRSLQSGDISSQVKLDDIEGELQLATHISLDSPVPYRIRDVSKILDHAMGRLENANNLAPYKRLKRRIATLIADPRYQFIFKNQASPRPIEDIVGPILLVCEEAHRYIPRDRSAGFHSTRRIISRIAKEGRKYGVSLGIISQRPSELEPSTLSQCSTIFSMRLSNEVDQNFVRAAVPDGAAELSAQFTELWQQDTATPELMEKVFDRWRARSLNPAAKRTSNNPAPRPQTIQATRSALKNRAPANNAMPTQTPRPATPTISQQPNALAAQVRERLKAKTASQGKPQSLSDVKSMLNSAFHKNI